MKVSPDTRFDEVLVLDRASDADNEKDGDPLHPDLVSLLSETGCPSSGEYLLSVTPVPRANIIFAGCTPIHSRWWRDFLSYIQYLYDGKFDTFTRCYAVFN